MHEFHSAGRNPWPMDCLCSDQPSNLSICCVICPNSGGFTMAVKYLLVYFWLALSGKLRIPLKASNQSVSEYFFVNHKPSPSESLQHLGWFSTLLPMWKSTATGPRKKRNFWAAGHMRVETWLLRITSKRWKHAGSCFQGVFGCGDAMINSLGDITMYNTVNVSMTISGYLNLLYSMSLLNRFKNWFPAFQLDLWPTSWPKIWFAEEFYHQSKCGESIHCGIKDL